MRARRVGKRWTWCTLLGGLALLGGAHTAWAQLTPADIDALRERGQREGWTFTVGENPATQRPLQQLCGLVVPPGWQKQARWDPSLPGRSLPAAWDWRTSVTLPAVRDQGWCGSCWAFAAIGVTECALAREVQISADLSEQWLVSCTWAGSCYGGWTGDALDYLRCGGEQDPCYGNGAVLESAFPYQSYWGEEIPCGCPYAHPYCLDSWVLVGKDYSTPTPEQIKQAIYDHGPVAVGIYANDAFSAYTGGIFNACESYSTNHAVVLVGWDDNQAGGVWILRNSWGAGWGEGGYMRIKYDCCRVGEQTMYVNYRPPDCNSNGVPDKQDITAGTSLDCNANGIPDECEPNGNTDCNNNGVKDLCDLFAGTSADCDGNGRPDECDIADGQADCNANGIPDSCELDVPYRTDDGLWDMIWGLGTSGDFMWINQFVVRPGGETVDEVLVAWGYVPTNAPATVALWHDPTGDGDPGDAELLWQSATVHVVGPMTSTFQSVDVPSVHVGAAGDVFFVGVYMHLTNADLSYPALQDMSVYPGGSWLVEGKDLEDLAANTLYDMDEYWGGVFLLRAHAAPPDCNANGVLDDCDVSSGASPDINANGLPDECDPDCNSNGLPDDYDVAQALSADCNVNGQPDECEIDLGVKIDTSPEDLTVCAGEAATFTVDASGAGTLHYQWRRYHVPIAGATASTYTIAAVTPADAGAFEVVVSSSCTSDLYPPVTSAAAMLTVESAVIESPPHDHTALVGEAVTFSVAATASKPLSFQWRKDGQPIAGAVFASFAIAAASLADAGMYDVLVSGCGTIASTAAKLTVLLARPELPWPDNGVTDVPLDVQLRWNAVAGADTYDVYLGADSTPALGGETRTNAWSPDGLKYGTKYFWKVVARSGDAQAEGLTWWFVTEPEPVPLPGLPSAPLPADGATGQPRELELRWTSAKGAALYKVMLGLDPALADGQLVGSTELCCCALAKLKYGTAYYWQVIAKNDGGFTSGPIWSFATQAEAPPAAEETTSAEPNVPLGEPDANEATSGQDNTLPTRPSALCPTTSTALLLATWLGLRGARRR